jgi:hypothetical protein
MIIAFRMIPPIIDMASEWATGRTGFAASGLLCKVLEVRSYGGLRYGNGGPFAAQTEV